MREGHRHDRPVLVHESELDVYTDSGANKDNLHVLVSPDQGQGQDPQAQTKSIGLILI